MTGTSRTILVDARWARHAGTSTFLTMLLRGLADVGAPGRWLVWGPPDFVDPLLWPGAVPVPTTVSPVSWFGQRSAFRVPAADVVLHPHQTRPLHRMPAATCVLDLIQLQEPNPALRLAKAARLRASVGAARVLFTISSSVRDELVARYKVDPAAVTTLRLPVDAGAAARVAARRSESPAPAPAPYLLAVGRFDRHKNLPRLIDAFTRTTFAAQGGRLLLAGGTSEELRRLGVAAVPPSVHVLGHVDQAGMEDAMAGATALVQASLAEGYGLPVAEALLAGVPVVSSPVPAVTEFGPAGLPTFDPRSVAHMTRVIDATVEAVRAGAYWTGVERMSWCRSQPTPGRLAEQVLGGLAGIGP